MAASLSFSSRWGTGLWKGPVYCLFFDQLVTYAACPLCFSEALASLLREWPVHHLSTRLASSQSHFLYPDIGKVGALSGAVFGSAMMFVFPPIMYIQALRKFGSASNSEGRNRIKATIAGNAVLLLAGLSLAVAGSVNTIHSILTS